MAQKQEEEEKVRLDKWLWAARFYKTRALAKAAIESGKVHHRGERCKPGKEPRVGDEFQIRTEFDEKTIVVQALSIVRRGAPEAQALYAETEASIAKRENAAAMRCYQKVGFQLEGVKRHAFFNDGHFADVAWMSVLAEEWRAARTDA